MCNQNFDFSQGIEGHPELILVAIVDDNGNVIPVLGGAEEQSQDEQPSDEEETARA